RRRCRMSSESRSPSPRIASASPPRPRSPRCRMATSSAWKTPASTRRKKGTIRPLSRSWRSSATSGSTTLFRRRTARTPRPKAYAANCAIILPVDAVVAFHFAANAPSHAYGLDAIPGDGMILDVGPQSVARIHAAIDDAATLVWNGPLGAFEMSPFDRGTMVAARHAAARTRAKKLISVAGGGDTVAALNQAGVASDFSYVSTAGGAFLEWMEGKPLPG